jgi:hypothetical protein
MRRVLFGVVGMVLLAGSASADLVNPGFETGNLTGWTVTASGTGSVSVVPSHSQSDDGDGPTIWDPQEGSHFALLKAGAANTPVKLAQTFTTSSAGVLNLEYFFDAGDALRSSGKGNDTAMGTLSLASGSVVLFSTSVSNVGDYTGTPWTLVSQPLVANSNYTLQFEVMNAADAKGPSYLGVDMSVVPLPGAVLLGFLGLSAAGLGLRKLA